MRFDLEDETDERLEDRIYYPALRLGYTAIAEEANSELYERVRNEHDALLAERDRRLAMPSVPGERIRAIMLNIKELRGIMAELRRTGMELAFLGPNINGGLN